MIIILVNSQSIVGQQLVDNWMTNYQPSVGKYFVDVSQSSIGHMSVVYWSLVSEIIVIC